MLSFLCALAITAAPGERVIFQLTSQSDYPTVAARLTRAFPGAIVSRGIDGEIVDALALADGGRNAEAILALAIVRRFVSVTPGRHPSAVILGWLRDQREVEPGPSITGPVAPGLAPSA